MNKKKKQHLINNEIKASDVRVAEQGVMSLQEALKLASDSDLDLVLINDKSTPPVCKIMNYEKFLYSLGKKDKIKNLEQKEFKLGPNMSTNDIEYRLNRIKEFLKKGHQIKLSMQFRGREMLFINKGKEIFLKLIVDVEEFGKADSMPKMEGKKMFCLIKPKSKN